MNTRQKLVLVKAVHTLIWMFYNAVVGYMLYASVSGEMGTLFWVCYGFLFLEGLILLLFKFICPLTLVARRYSESPKDNFDIYLPEWLARHTKRIYFSIVVVIIMITVWQYVR